MYQFSRAIYRELAPDVIEVPGGSANRRAVLVACEATCDRLASDRDFAKPTRTLFREIRVYFPLERQMRVYHVIQRHLEAAGGYVGRALAEGRSLDGSVIHCRASTRGGRPCRRDPLPGLEHCPSHRHLAEAPRIAASA
ncbi:MAG TPA: hypothetical protein VK486_14430 [Thermoleophilaceae bacterium]|nr:hypothetical protein [Thermoleophilaceae bacterium]